MGRVDSGNDPIFIDYSHTLTLLLLTTTSVLCVAQGTPQEAHTPSIATLAVARVQVPDVRGRRPEDAQAILRRAGLQPGATTTKPTPGVVGTVGEQYPPANSVAVRGTTFNLVVVASQGGQNSDGDEEFSRQVPSLQGLTPNQASNLLERSRLQMGNISAGNGKGPEGTIYSQNPREGTWARIGSKVDVEIVVPPKSPGPGDQTIWVFVPDLSGQTQKAAEETLREHGLTLGTVSLEAASTQTGTVFAQFPRPDSKVAQATAISVRIAKAAPSQNVTVPDLRGQQVEKAKSALEQIGLRLGPVTSGPSDATPDSIISQSPNPGMTVERGSAVDVTIAKAIQTVSVPNLVQHDQAEAVAILQRDGLQLGSVNRSEGDAATGSIVSQNPKEGAQVRVGTSVNVTVSLQTSPQLTVMVDPSNREIGKPIGFHAHLEPPEKGVKYRFTFGDGQDSGLLVSSKTSHVYRKSGDFVVEGFVTSGDKTIAKDSVTVTIPSFPWKVPATLAAGLLALAGGLRYHRWKTFRRWVRVIPKTDVGIQHLSIASRGNPDPCVRVRVQQGTGQSEVHLPDDDSGG